MTASEHIAVEELRGYVKPELHTQLHDLLGQVYLIDMGSGNASRYFPRAWVDRFADDIQERTGETIDALYGRLSVEQLSALLSSDDNPHSALLRCTMDFEEWRRAQNLDYRVFSATVDYSATGEGRTLHFISDRATSMADFMVHAVGKIGAYFSLGMSLYEGMPERGDAAADFLVTDQMRQFLESDPKAALDNHLYFHFNFS